MTSAQTLCLQPQKPFSAYQGEVSSHLCEGSCAQWQIHVAARLTAISHTSSFWAKRMPISFPCEMTEIHPCREDLPSPAPEMRFSQSLKLKGQRDGHLKQPGWRQKGSLLRKFWKVFGPWWFERAHWLGLFPLLPWMQLCERQYLGLPQSPWFHEVANLRSRSQHAKNAERKSRRSLGLRRYQ